MFAARQMLGAAQKRAFSVSASQVSFFASLPKLCSYGHSIDITFFLCRPQKSLSSVLVVVSASLSLS